MAARSDKTDDRQELSEDEKILQEAKDRFARVQEWESYFRNLYVVDVKFANGDSDNGWQWPDDLRRDREVNKRPALTINKTAQHVALITNEARQNKTSVNIKPVGAASTYDAAQVYEGIVRHIEYISGAQAIYDEAMESQVEGGIGWWRVNTSYVDDDSFDQEIRIEPVRDHLSVYLDCDIKQKDGSDAKFGFVFDDMPRKEFERQFPNIELPPAQATGLNEDDDWVRSDNVRIAEYYRIVEKADELIYMEDEAGVASTFRRSDIPEKFRAKFGQSEKDGGREIKKRKVRTKQLEWYKIAGSEIVDRRKLKGKYVPLVRVVGKERIIQGKLERKGHVRALKDPQRMYNYNSSGQVEFGALATKSPWVGPADAFSGNETDWNNANRQNKAYLTYRHRDEEGNEIPKPERPDPPGASPAFIEGMKIAAAELEMASGQYQAQQQNPSVERTPAAIGQRAHQGDLVTALYNDNFALAKRYTGMIILDWVPHYYDTERVIQILARDGTQSKVTIKPDSPEAYQAQKERDEVVNVLFNPKVGKYQVEADVGPAYATQRQEAWDAFVKIVTGAPELINEIGDLMFQSADFPLADKIAERLKRKIRNAAPWLLDDNAPGPEQQKLQAELKQAGETIAELMQKLAEQRLKLIGKDQMRDIEAHEAESKRLTALSNAEPELNQTGQIPGLRVAIEQTIMNMLESGDITALINKTQQENGQSAPDGQGDVPMNDVMPEQDHLMAPAQQ